MHFLELFDIRIVLGDALQRQLIHQVDNIRLLQVLVLEGAHCGRGTRPCSADPLLVVTRSQPCHLAWLQPSSHSAGLSVGIGDTPAPLARLTGDRERGRVKEDLSVGREELVDELLHQGLELWG